MPDSNPSQPRPGLDTGGGSLDRAVQDDLERQRLDQMSSSLDHADRLMADVEKGARDSLARADLGELDRGAPSRDDSFLELEQLLVNTDCGLELDGKLLAELLREGGESKSIIKAGLAFIKNRKFSEALEWWSLNRASHDPKTSRLFLLLLIMETFTHLWAGNEDRARAMSQTVRSHPIFRAAGPPQP